MSTPPVVVTVVDAEPEQQGGAADAGVAFAAGVAAAEAGQAAEDADAALQAAESAQATADAALSVAIDATLSEGQCCAHCDGFQADLADLRERLAAIEDGALQEHAEPAPEKVEPAVTKTEDSEDDDAPQRYGNKRWFGGS